MAMPPRGLTFHQEIQDAVAGRERLVLVVGPKAALSDYVRQEWQFALQAGGGKGGEAKGTGVVSRSAYSLGHSCRDRLLRTAEAADTGVQPNRWGTSRPAVSRFGLTAWRCRRAG